MVVLRLSIFQLTSTSMNLEKKISFLLMRDLEGHLSGKKNYITMVSIKLQEIEEILGFQIERDLQKKIENLYFENLSTKERDGLILKQVGKDQKVRSKLSELIPLRKSSQQIYCLC